uniref:PX domain-containing protein n=1 Tax=Equus asinus TaxID=9793 RepID=A0A8C4M3W8_EQUAS
MASAVFEGTSLVNMFVRGCWVNGIRRLIVSRRGDEEEFFEIRTEWSDRSVLYLHRSFADLGRLWQRLRDAFPEDRPELARAPLRQGLVAIKEAHDIETRLNEVEKLLKTIIGMPCKYSRSEVVLTFFERSPLDQVLKNDNVHKIQPSFQSPVKISGHHHPFEELVHTRASRVVQPWSHIWDVAGFGGPSSELQDLKSTPRPEDITHLSVNLPLSPGPTLSTHVGHPGL